MVGGVMGLLILLVGVAVIGGAAMLISGRWRDGLPEVAPEGAESAPIGRDVPVGGLTVEDVEAVRLEQAPRGYRMDEVDALVGRLSEEIAVRDEEIARLRADRPSATANPPRSDGVEPGLPDPQRESDPS